jgi:hypothetical protein
MPATHDDDGREEEPEIPKRNVALSDRIKAAGFVQLK